MWVVLRDGREVGRSRFGWFARAWARWSNCQPEAYPAVYEARRTR